MDLAALEKANSEGKLEIEKLSKQLEAAEKQIQTLETEKVDGISQVCINIHPFSFLLLLFYICTVLICYGKYITEKNKFY